MQVKIKDEVKNVQVTSVTLAHDMNDEFGMNLYMFHCIRCGSPILQYQGFVTHIVPGLVPTTLPMILRCNNSRCKHYYSFQSLV